MQRTATQRLRFAERPECSDPRPCAWRLAADCRLSPFARCLRCAEFAEVREISPRARGVIGVDWRC